VPPRRAALPAADVLHHPADVAVGRARFFHLSRTDQVEVEAEGLRGEIGEISGKPGSAHRQHVERT
jgi:hypothetical protein